MVDLASLRISVDSRDVKKAEGDLASMSNTAGSTSAAVDRLSAANNRLAQAVASSHKPTIDAVKYINQLQYEVESVGKSALQLKALEIRMAAARAPTAELAQEIRNLGAELIKTERAAARSGGGPNGIPAIGKSSGLATHHVQNLTFQLQDMFVGLASGQKPMTVFMQQGTQIGGIMQQAGMGVGGFTKEVLKMGAAAAAALLLNPAFLAVAAAAGVAYVAFQDFNAEVKNSGELDKYAAGLGLTAEEMKKLGPVGITAMDVVKGVWQTISEGLGLDKVFSSIGGFFKDLFRGVASTAADLAAGLYGLFVGTYKGIVKTWDMLPAAFADLTISAVNYSIRALEGLVNKSINLINGMIERVNKVAAAVKLPTIGLLSQVDIPQLQNNYAGAAKKAGNAFMGEITNAVKDARGAMSAVGSTLGNNIIGQAKKRISGQAKELIDERTTRKAAEKAGKDAGEKFAETLTKNISDALGKVDMLQGKDFYKTLGIDPAKDMADIMQEIGNKREGEAALREASLEREMKIATDGADLIAKTIGGSIGNSVNKLMNVFKKDFPDFARKLGTSFDSIKGGFDRILGGFGTSLKTVAGGFAVGGAVGGIVGGSATGGAIGGAFGSALGETFKSLGKFGGPLGAIAGGILGSVVGGLFAKTKQASATISAAAGKLDVAGIVGNNAQFKQTANTLAGAVIDGLNSAANALGAEITNAINLSIGQRKGKFVVDLQGMGRTKGAGTMAFGTEAEAISFALDKAIRDGIFSGIRAGTERLLKGFGDVEDRLAKAVDFEGVFTALRKETDPLGFAIEELDKRFAALRQTFQEAGATVDEYAQLEQLYQIERNKAVEANTKVAEEEKQASDIARQARELEIALLEAQGDTLGAITLRRQEELAAMDASLHGLQQQIWLAQDAAEAQAKANELAMQRRLLEIELMDALGNSSEALAARRELELQAMDGSLQALQKQIWATKDAAKASVEASERRKQALDDEIRKEEELARITQERAEKVVQAENALRQAYNREAEAFNNTISKFKDLGNSLREFASTIVPLNGTGQSSIDQLNEKFRSTLNLALLGNVEAMGQIPEVGGQLRDAIIGGATDRISMMRQLLILKADTESVASIADNHVSIAEQQLEALNAQVGKFVTLNESVLSVRDAIIALQALTAAEKGLKFTGPDMFEIPAEYRQLVGAFEKRVADIFSGSGVQHIISPNDARDIAPYLDPNKYVMLPNGAIVPRGSSGHISAIESINFGMGGSITQSLRGPSMMARMIGAANQFANGGIHNGGLRIVGENGPELEATGPSRIYNANQLSDMMNNRTTAEEVKSLRDELKLAMYQIAKNTGKSYDLLNRWDGDGLPPERIVA